MGDKVVLCLIKMVVILIPANTMGRLLIICDIIITIVKVTIKSTTMAIKGILMDIKPITANVITIMVTTIITKEDTVIHTTIITRDGEPIKDVLIPPTITKLTTDTIKVGDSNHKLHAVVHSLMILLFKDVRVMINLILHIMIYIMLITKIINMICIMLMIRMIITKTIRVKKFTLMMITINMMHTLIIWTI